MASLNFIGTVPAEEQVNAIGESEAPPNANDAQVSEPPDDSNEWCVNALGQPVPKKGPKSPFCGLPGHAEDTCWKKNRTSESRFF